MPASTPLKLTIGMFSGYFLPVTAFLFRKEVAVTVYHNRCIGVRRPDHLEKGVWNLDGEFDSADLVLAFQCGNYSTAAKPAKSELAAAVDWLFAEDERGAGPV